MTPAPPPARPRPRPRPAPRPQSVATDTASAQGDRPVPALADRVRTFAHRHPRLLRQGSLAAIVGGVALFVTAAITTPFAGADGRGHPARHPAADTQPTQVLLTPAVAIPDPAVVHAVQQKPTHVTKTAPVTTKVISGLAANGIPQVALNAYRVAAARMANVDAGCGIDWALLAGIGREESDHGRFAGASLHADGISTPPIIGPALDGVHWDYVPAPANGAALDGDARYAHALGPMQFIPSTWAIYGTDANGDGKADVFNINDAALGAARYLCAAGGNLRSHDGQVRGVLAYNHSDEYLAQVLALADAYRRGVPVSGLPVGITSGALPTITSTGAIPPANPAAPTAVAKKASPTKPAKHPGSTPTSAHASAAPHGTSSSAPHPTTAPSTGGHGSPTPKPSGSTPNPTPSKSDPPASSGSTTSASPTAPKSTCNPLQVMLHLCPGS